MVVDSYVPKNQLNLSSSAASLVFMFTVVKLKLSQSPLPLFCLPLSIVFSFSSLFEGLMMLDREEKTLSGVIEKIVDALVSNKEIQPGDRDKVLQALMHKQRYYTHHTF